MALSEQYNRLDQWLKQLSHLQYTLVVGVIWTIMWTGLEFFQGGQSLWSSALIGGFGGLVFGGLHYFWMKEN